MPIPNLEGKNICLAGLSPIFADDMFEYSQLPEFYRYMELEPHRSIEDTKIYLNKLLRRTDDGKSIYWAICLKKQYKMIGTFGVVNMDEKIKKAQIGYGISPYYWNRGVFKEALSLVIDYCHKGLGLEKIEAKTMADNIPSIKGLLRFGFRREKYIEKYYFKSDGTRSDALILGLYS